MNARDPSFPLQADDISALGAFAEKVWDEEIVPALTDYIAIPAKSPMFDADWASNGYIERVIRDAAQWVESKKIPGLKLEVIRLEGRTPVIFFELPATKADSTLEWFVMPMIGSKGWLFSGFIDGSMRSQSTPEQQRHTMSYYRDVGMWKRLTGYTRGDDAVLIVLGADGRVSWLGAGPHSEATEKALLEALRTVKH